MPDFLNLKLCRRDFCHYDPFSKERRLGDYPCGTRRN